MTRAVAAKRQLLTQLSAWSALADVRVSYAPPTEATDATREQVWLGDIVDHEQEWHALRGTSIKRDETFDIQLVAFVARRGDDASAVEQACEQLVDKVEQAIRADVTIGGLVTFAGPTDFAWRTRATAEDGWRCQAEFVLSCRVHRI